MLNWQKIELRNGGNIKEKILEFNEIADQLIEDSKNLEPVLSKPKETIIYGTYQGLSGPTGANGMMGPQGIIGPQAYLGPMGAMGPVGPMGPEPSDERLKELINQVLDERGYKKRGYK